MAFANYRPGVGGGAASDMLGNKMLLNTGRL